MSNISIEQKLDIVSRHFADRDIDYKQFDNLLRQTYIKGFKEGYSRATIGKEQLHDAWRIANITMQCDICHSQFPLANWDFCPVCGTCMDGQYEEKE